MVIHVQFELRLKQVSWKAAGITRNSVLQVERTESFLKGNLAKEDQGSSGFLLEGLTCRKKTAKGAKTMWP